MTQTRAAGAVQPRAQTQSHEIKPNSIVPDLRKIGLLLSRSKSTNCVLRRGSGASAAVLGSAARLALHWRAPADGPICSLIDLPTGRGKTAKTASGHSSVASSDAKIVLNSSII